MAMTGDPIVAYPGTYTGSIGVVMLKPTLHGLYDKLGITIDGLSRGRFANLDSTYHPLSPAERQKLRERIDDTYRAFVTKEADARKRQFTEIDAMAQGRVWLGSQAKPKGLVDELGGIDRAIELVKDKAKIGRQEKVTIISYPARRTIFDLALGRNPDSSFESRFPVLSKLLKNWQTRALLQGGVLRMMPYAIEIR
jgi:protease-4